MPHAPHPGRAGMEGNISVAVEIMLAGTLPHFSSLLISRTIFSICLILQNILKLWECCGEGFYWAGRCPQARSRNKDGWLTS